MITPNGLDVHIGDVWEFSHSGFNDVGKWEVVGSPTTFLVVNINVSDGVVKNVYVVNLNDFHDGVKSYGFEVKPERYRLLARI